MLYICLVVDYLKDIYLQESEIALLNLQMKQALDGVEEMQLNKFEAEILKERAENDKRLMEVSFK